MPKFTEYFEDAQAQMVYLLLKHQHDTDDANDADQWLVERFVNGREHGYTVHGMPLWGGSGSRYVSFSEYRNTDQIVVYPYWHETGSEQDYRTKTIWFPAGAFAEVAEWIGLYLTGKKVFTPDPEHPESKQGIWTDTE